MSIEQWWAVLQHCVTALSHSGDATAPAALPVPLCALVLSYALPHNLAIAALNCSLLHVHQQQQHQSASLRAAASATGAKTAPTAAVGSAGTTETRWWLAPAAGHG